MYPKPHVMFIVTMPVRDQCFFLVSLETFTDGAQAQLLTDALLVITSDP